MSEIKKKFGILIVAHSGLASQYLATVEHVLGKQEQIAYVAIEDSDDKNAQIDLIKNLIQKLDTGSGTVIATDMFGGTPSNLALKCLEGESYRILYGVSMPSLIKLFRSRTLPIDQALDAAVTAGHRYLNYCSEHHREAHKNKWVQKK